MKPFIKWAGGKIRFADKITAILGKECNNYFEPFLGSGAVLLQMTPNKAFCSDVNVELINLYQIVKDKPEELINELKCNFIPFHSKPFYYEIRSWDREDEYLTKYNPVRRAARFVYLNRTCYNGIWRVNQKGQNNVPYGKYINPVISQDEAIMIAHDFFVQRQVDFQVSDYEFTIRNANKGDVVYFDPPYDKEQGLNSFVRYNKTIFGRDEQIRLKETCDRLIAKGVTVGISNSGTSFIIDLYKGYDIEFFNVKRMIGSSKESRHNYTEVFIYKKG